MVCLSAAKFTVASCTGTFATDKKGSHQSQNFYLNITSTLRLPMECGSYYYLGNHLQGIRGFRAEYSYSRTSVSSYVVDMSTSTCHDGMEKIG
jgi:hypothetical protein